MFKSTTTYKVSRSTYINKIFPDGLPVNAFIDKGRCAIGGTTQEIQDKSRCTILIVPNTSILLNKLLSSKGDERPDYIVYGDIKLPEVQKMMQDKRSGIKIMSTPEGIWKIIKAAERERRLEEVYKQWFLLLDESHTFISEAYRKNILLPFKYFWSFDNKSIISATPYYFSDPGFHDLDYHQITFTEKLGKVTVVNASSVVGTLNYLLKNVHEFPGNVHIFYNSVTEIRNAVLNAELTECSIYCADDKDSSNMDKLGELKKFFVPEPHESNYKKINFYTCKYFEGWDLYDVNATVVLVTDCFKLYTKVGVASKGKQAMGRLRNPAYQIIHITNHEHKNQMVLWEEYKEEYLKDAKRIIKDYNDAILNSRFNKFTKDERLKFFADIDKNTKLATLNLNLLDQQINESASNEVYKNIKFIIEDWNKAYFDVEMQYSDHKLETKTERNRKSAATKLKEDYFELESLLTTTTLTFHFGKSAEQQIAERNPIAYKAFKLLNKQLVENLKYNPKKLEREIILRENEDAEVKLMKLLKRTFTFKKGNDFYFNSFITSKLQELYKKVGLKDAKTGQVKRASPSDLGEEGRFIIKIAKRTNPQGKRENGVIIIGHRLGLKTTE
ncbi:hypothetical protein [Rubrolithibacter danxiaensis]|uniref:hypothetical protein n=1 Tax=Rubrolithibacter danxiaensis TaxID=3390805 RepID=UPI003BF8D007